METLRVRKVRSANPFPIGLPNLEERFSYFSAHIITVYSEVSSYEEEREVMTAFVSQPAPDFKADAYVNGEFREVSLSQYKGKKVVLFFYPLDFTFVCPTEILAFSDTIDEFKKRNTEI